MEDLLQRGLTGIRMISCDDHAAFEQHAKLFLAGFYGNAVSFISKRMLQPMFPKLK
jgi:hypothetical protein